MKTKLLTVGLLLSVTTICKAQVSEIDYEEINQRNAEKINTDYQNDRSASRSKTADFFKTLFTIDSRPLTKKVKYTDIEKEQINLISCTRNFLQKHKGGYDGPKIAQKILMSAMEDGSLSRDFYTIEEATSACKDAYKNLYNFKKKAINENEYKVALNSLPASSPSEVKTKKLVSALGEQRNEICKMSGLEVEAYIALGGGVGVNNLKCLRSDGRIINYIGPSIKLGYGFGAAAGVKVVNDKDHDSFEAETSKILSGSLESGTMDNGGWGNMESGFILTKPIKHRDESMQDGLKVGVIVVPASLNFGGGIRVFNGKTQWYKLLEILN